jgi:hypothetical protein
MNTSRIQTTTLNAMDTLVIHHRELTDTKKFILILPLVISFIDLLTYTGDPGDPGD